MTARQQIDETARKAREEGRRDCATCLRRTVERQRLSLATSTHWLALYALAQAVEGLAELPDSLDIASCRAVPDCDGLGCEAPFRRDPRSRQTLTTDVAEVFLSSVAGDPYWLASLYSGAIQLATQTVHVPARTDPRLGPAAIHAAVVANNLLRAGWPGLDAPPSVNDTDTQTASEPSLQSLEILVFPPDPDAVKPSDGTGDARIIYPRTARVQYPGGVDLLTIHLLNQGLDRLMEVEGVEGQLKRRLIKAVTPIRLVWWKRLLRRLGLWPDPDAATRLPTSGRPVFQLPAEAQATKQRLARCDLLRQAESGFAGTPLDDIARAALLLKNLRRSPDADLVLPRLCRGLVAARSGAGIIWLATLGARLLDDDPDSAGAEVSSLLLAELIASVRGPAMDGTLENSALWGLLAAETPGDEPAGGPRWIFRLCCRAAALQENAPDASRFEQLLVDRVLSAATAFWGGPPLVTSAWQRLLLRCLELFLCFDSPQDPLPSGCGLARLSAHALRVREALEQQGENASPELLELVERVWALPRFPYWSRKADAVVQSLPSPKSTFDIFFFQHLASGRGPDYLGSAAKSSTDPGLSDLRASGGAPVRSGPTGTGTSGSGRGSSGGGAAIAIPTGKKKKKR